MSAFKYILVLLQALMYAFVAYFPQHVSDEIFVLIIGVSFLFYFYFIFRTYDKSEISALLWSSLLLRAIFIVAIPVFSSNFSEYISNGNELLMVDGLPLWTIDNKTLPLLNLLSGFGAWLNGFDTVWALLAFRIPILIAEFLIIKFLRKLVIKLKTSINGLLWYALNPLVIIEFSYHINFMSIAICLLVMCLYFILVHKWLGAAISFGISLLLNLFPLLFLFIITRKLGTVRSVLFVLTLGLVLVIGYFPFLYGIDETTLITIFDYFKSTYISSGVYNYFVNLNTPYIAESVTAVLMIVVPLLMFFTKITRKGFVQSMMLIMALFLLLSMNTNATYIIPILLLSSIYQEYKFSFVWLSVAVFVPYVKLELLQLDYWKELMVLMVVASILGRELLKYRKTTLLR